MNYLGFLIAFVGSLVIGWNAVKEIRESLYFKNHGILTTGKVIKANVFEDKDNADGTIIRHKLLLQFRTNDNQLIDSQIIKDEPYYHEGLDIHILYDPKNPNSFLVNDPKATEKLSISLIYLIAFLAFAALSVWLLKRK